MVNEIILFECQDIKLEINIKDEIVWLTQAQMAKLFGRDVAVISRPITKMFKDELKENSNLQKKMQIAG